MHMTIRMAVLVRMFVQVLGDVVVPVRVRRPIGVRMGVRMLHLRRTMRMLMFAVVLVRMRMRRAVGMRMGVPVRLYRRAVRVLVLVVVGMGMRVHRAIAMHVCVCVLTSACLTRGVRVRRAVGVHVPMLMVVLMFADFAALDTRLADTAAASCTHLNLLWRRPGGQLPA
jgi:hypothetical protein